MTNVVQLRTGERAGTETSAPVGSEGDVLQLSQYRPWQGAPVKNGPNNSWMSPRARRRWEASQAARPVEEAQPVRPTPRTLPELMAAAAARPPRDLSRELRELPPVAGVEKTLSILVPAVCVARPWGSDFLNAGSPAKGRVPCVQETCIQEISEPSGGGHVEDAKTLSATKLRERYKLTYSSWQNMKGRRREGRCTIDPRLEEFADFLTWLGPRTSRDVTLDRIDNSDREYAPGKVRWLDKKGQANNREETIYLAPEGVTKPLSVWAEETRQEAGTLRARRRKGWNDFDVVYGRQEKAKASDQRPWNYHTDAETRLVAEEFYLKGRLPDETPLKFCLRIARAGLNPWGDFLRYYFDWSEGDPFSGVAPHCIPELETAQQMMKRLAPVREWIERTVAALGDQARASAPIPAARRAQQASRPSAEMRKDIYDGVDDAH